MKLELVIKVPVWVAALETDSKVVVALWEIE